MRQETLIVLASQTAASVNSNAIPSQNLFNASAQMVVTGAGAGTLVIQGSNDPVSSTPVNFTNIPNATVTIAGAGSYLIPKTDLCYAWVRVSYTNTGSGTIACNMHLLGE